MLAVRPGLIGPATNRIHHRKEILNLEWCRRRSTDGQKKSRPLERGRDAETCCPEATGPFSTNSDLTRLDCFGFWQMDSQQPLFNASADFRRIDAGIEIENAAVFTGLSFTMHGSSEFARREPVAAEDQFAVLNGDFYTLLVYARHFHFESVPVSILVKVHPGRKVFHALSRLTLGFGCR